VLVLLDDRLFVHYGFVSMTPDDEDYHGTSLNFDEGVAGQRNGLCGAAVPGCLAMLTGRHTGYVPWRVEWHEDEPQLDPMWEDVVEVSFRPEMTGQLLQTFQNHYRFALPRVTDMRVRFCGRDMDTSLGNDAVDSYMLQFWPAPPQGDNIVRQTSSVAAYHHRKMEQSSRRTG
jgi:hypothetical protein